MFFFPPLPICLHPVVKEELCLSYVVLSGLRRKCESVNVGLLLLLSSSAHRCGKIPLTSDDAADIQKLRAIKPLLHSSFIAFVVTVVNIRSRCLKDLSPQAYGEFWVPCRFTCLSAVYL